VPSPSGIGLSAVTATSLTNAWGGRLRRDLRVQRQRRPRPADRNCALERRHVEASAQP
jgi:hypothetical protein